ncbi:MAG: methyltransferase domain-containing protein [Planctomycetes bacterium]|nr:methyltransferase domain-containing protein [Planctomycetota bacterium]
MPAAADPDQYDDVAERGFEDHACWPITETLLDLVQIGPGGKLLDIACGTGIVARRAARRLGSTGRAVGVDLSRGRLEYARRLSATDGLVTTEFIFMDACSLEFAENSFDAAVAQFPHLPDRATCFRGILTVLRPGGWFAIGNGGGGAPRWPGCRAPVFSGRQEAILDGVFDRMFSESFRGATAAAPSRPGPVIASPDQELLAAGFVEVQSWSCDHTAPFLSGADAFEFEATRNSGFRTLRSSLSPGLVAEFRNRYIAEADRRRQDGGAIGLTSGALIAAGRKPIE